MVWREMTTFRSCIVRNQRNKEMLCVSSTLLYATGKAADANIATSRRQSGMRRNIRDLGYLYQEGWGVVQSDKRAFEWYKKSAAKGDMNAQNNLGTCYEDGTGVPQNYQEARRLYKLASAQGLDVATKYLMRVEELIRNDPTQALTRPTANKKPKPNAPCSCGSGKKYKKCCGSNK